MSTNSEEMFCFVNEFKLFCSCVLYFNTKVIAHRNEQRSFLREHRYQWSLPVPTFITFINKHGFSCFRSSKCEALESWRVVMCVYGSGMSQGPLFSTKPRMGVWLNFDHTLIHQNASGALFPICNDMYKLGLGVCFVVSQIAVACPLNSTRTERNPS